LLLRVVLSRNTDEGVQFFVIVVDDLCVRLKERFPFTDKVLATAAIVLITVIGRFAIGYWKFALLAIVLFPCAYLKDNKDYNTEANKKD